jgi:hypothetical protein
MINHARTLLMNIPGAASLNPELGEEIIPATYQPKVLPQGLQNIRRVLFGANPDRAMLNYRCRQLLSLLHRTELESFITALDSRITYDFTSTESLSSTRFKPVATLMGSYSPSDLTDIAVTWDENRPDFPDVTGHMRRDWWILINGSSQLDITSANPARTTTVDLTFTNQLSQPVQLPGSSLFVQVRDTAGLSYHIQHTIRPQYDLGTLAATLRTLGTETFTTLFLTGTSAGSSEPFTTFRNLWEQRKELPYCLGGLLLALIYHTDLL